MEQKNRAITGIVIFCIADILETWWILSKGIGIELNPMYGYIGLWGITAVKILMVSLMIYAGMRDSTGKILGWTALLLAIPAIWNLFVIFG